MKRARTRRPFSPVARSSSESSNSFVGQMSGQRVKPKKTRCGAPRKSRSVALRPFWSTSSNGPPTFAAPAGREAGAGVGTGGAGGGGERRAGGDPEPHKTDEEGRERHRKPPQPIGRGHPRSLQKHPASAA